MEHAQEKAPALHTQHKPKVAETAALNQDHAAAHAPGGLLERAQEKDALLVQQQIAQAYCLEQEEQQPAQAPAIMIQVLVLLATTIIVLIQTRCVTAQI